MVAAHIRANFKIYIKAGDSFLVYQTMVLAGLLHGLGNIVGPGKHADAKSGDRHLNSLEWFIKEYKDILSEICDTALLEKLLLQNHQQSGRQDEKQKAGGNEADDISNLSLMLEKAAGYSLGQNSCSEGNNQYKNNQHKDNNHKNNQHKPLDALFCRVDIGKKLPGNLQYRLEAYSPAHVFPAVIKEHQEAEYKKISKAFWDELAVLLEDKPGYEKLYTGLLALLMKYTWCLPANGQEKISDIPLFDHLKTTSAITACLYLHHRNKESSSSINDSRTDNRTDSRAEFLLVAGNIAGMRPYILSEENIAANDVAGNLKARYFYVNILAELLSYNLIWNMGLYPANIIMASGSKFYILAPNTGEAKEELAKYQQEADALFLSDFQGELSFNLAAVELSGPDFDIFGSVLRSLNHNLENKERIPFISMLQHNGKWAEEHFTFELKDEKGMGWCSVCEQELAVKMINDTGYGERCLRYSDMGKKIPRTRFLELLNDKSDINYGPYSIKLSTALKDNNTPAKDKSRPAKDKSLLAKDKNRLTIVLNDNNIPRGRSSYFKYISNYTPGKDGRSLTLKETAEAGRGIKRLAFLEISVDNYEQLLFCSLITDNNINDKNKDNDKDKERYDNIAGIVSLNRMVDLFFAGYPDILIKERYPECYTVYADIKGMLFIGPWNKVIDLAIELQERFTQYTCNNHNMTISAGIAFATAGTPVTKTLKQVDRLLEKSKTAIRTNQQESGNQVSVFGKTIGWDTLKAVRSEGMKLSGWIKDKKMTKSDLWKLKRYDRMYADYLNNQRVEGLQYKAFLAYQLGRIKKDRGYNRDLVQWQERLFDEDNMEVLGPVVDYANYISLRR